MNSVYKVCKSGSCGVSIVGVERANGEYLEDTTTVSIRNYTFLQSITLNALTSVKADGTENLEIYGFVNHITDTVDESDFEMPIDGLYTISHIILPTNEWLTDAISKDCLTGYSIIYYYDTASKSLKKYVDNTKIDATIEELLAINSLSTSTIIRADKSTFCLCRLNNCFYNMSKNLLSQYQNTCYNKLDSLKYAIYLRDIVWMAINTIKYLIEGTQYYEAQSILEDITKCNGMCSNIITNVSSGGDCGCNS